MSRRRAQAETGFGELSGSGLRLMRSVSQAETQVGTQSGTEVWAQVSA